jgi:enoyl-CoA hydratase
MPDYADLLVENRDRTCFITLNRPDKLNALSERLLRELASAVEVAEHDPDVHVVVLRGAGRAFCAGYDMVERPAKDPGSRTVSRFGPMDDLLGLLERTGCLEQLWRCRLPVVAQVHGHCLAGGTDLALNCDIVIAAEDARIGYPPVRTLGVAPMQMWLYHAGPQWTKRLLFTGDTVSGRAAERIGLAQEAVPAGLLEETVAGLARRIGEVGRELLIGAKLVVNEGVELMGRSSLQRIAASQDAIGHRSASAREFREKVARKGFVAAMAEENARFGPGHIDR